MLSLNFCIFCIIFQLAHLFANILLVHLPTVSINLHLPDLRVYIMHGFVKYKFLLILYLLLSDFTTAFGSNILYAAAVASPSHHIWNRALAFELANRGHNVTHIGPDQDDVPKPLNYSHILLEGI
jgi:hypothetical protein